MIIDCLTCPVRGQRCDDCVVTVLSAPGSAGHLVSPEPDGPTGVQLDAAETKVVSMLVGAGLVSAEAAAGLRARRERVHARGAERDVG
jgi:hypothetical protein